MTSPLERRYRLLLRAYPAAYRTERGDEIVGVLLDLAPPGRAWPTVGDAADLVGSGLRRRLRLPIVDGLTAGLALAGPVALALAAGLSACLWVWLEAVKGLHTTGPAAYAAWLAAAVAYALGRARVARTLVVLAAATALALPVAGPFVDLDRPPLWVSMVLAAFGVIAAAGLRAPASADERLGVGAGTPTIAVCATALVATAGAPPGPATAYYQPTLARVGLVVAVAVAIHALIAGVRLTAGRPARAWLWATVLLALPGGWLGPFGDHVVAGVPGGANVEVAPHFGRLAQVLLATCVVGVAVAWLIRAEAAMGVRSRRAAPTPAPERWTRPLGVTRWLTVGAALGLAATIAALALPPYLAYASSMPRPRTLYVATTVALLAATALARAAVDVRSLPAARRARAALLAVVGALAAAFVGGLVAVYDNGWTLRGWAHLDLTANLVTTLALVPFALFALDAAPSVAPAAAGQPRGERAVIWWTLLASAGWLAYTTVPHLLSWGPVLLLLSAGLLALVLVTNRRPRTG
ncbi:hypothetical protein [Luedemannella helvata]|uniref:Uncharacterized protein n=1 Tax=Luedemannella helvata TaxID=349315 RepID=A0ABN2JUV5_9ACTN